jgi:hypothetical protein
LKAYGHEVILVKYMGIMLLEDTCL